MDSLELFAGAGGLALGLAKAGFKHRAIVEIDSDACSTLRQNKSRVSAMRDWKVVESDVRAVDFSQYKGVELVAGGVPCQPFSIAGKHAGHADERNMFPVIVSAIRKLEPKAVLIENVRGLKRKTFAKYFSYIELMLAYPDLEPKADEDWVEHLHRLERYHTKGRRDSLHYHVVHEVLNAADFGVPQKRERVFLVGIRADLNVEFSFPAPTHSKEALLWDQCVTGEYWERNKVPRNKRRPPLSKDDALNSLQDSLLRSLKPWQTVREAISDLPEPANERQVSEPFSNHFLVKGARSYVGHTGSEVDMPSKTLKAGDHGVPGGENTVLYPDGHFRYFTIRESARIQTFPDRFLFPASWTESMRQIGNAVPVELAATIGNRLQETLC